MPSPELLPTRIPGKVAPSGMDRMVITTDPGIGEVLVRWRLGRVPAWRCQLCGPQFEADCAHTFSAGVRLAQDLLGLTPEVPQERTTA